MTVELLFDRVPFNIELADGQLPAPADFYA